MLWANDTQDKINSCLNPILLDFYQKKNLRSLSNTESQEIETLKSKVLFSLQPFENIDEAKLIKILANVDQKNTKSILMGYNIWLKNLTSTIGKQLTVEDIKQAKTAFYIQIHSEEG